METILQLLIAARPKCARANLLFRHKLFPLGKNAMGLNVLMFGFDSVSRMSWIRNLPKSYEYYTEHLGGLVLDGYNIVGDGTPQALLPILTGGFRPETRKHTFGGPPHSLPVHIHIYTQADTVLSPSWPREWSDLMESKYVILVVVAADCPMPAKTVFS